MDLRKSERLSVGPSFWIVTSPRQKGLSLDRPVGRYRVGADELAAIKFAILCPFQYRGGDVGRQEGQAEQPRDPRRCYALAGRQGLDVDLLLTQLQPVAMRLTSRVGFYQTHLHAHGVGQSGRNNPHPCLCRGAGPGSDWARSLRPGDEFDVFDPRASLDVSRLSGPVLLKAVGRRPYAGSAQFGLRVDDLENGEAVLASLNMSDRRLLPRCTSDDHLGEVERLLPALARSGATFVLTGKPTSLQRIRQAPRGLDVRSGRPMTKAYWTPGKVGLD
jgi:hypothetical protein